MAWTVDLPPNRNGIVRVKGVYRTADGKERSKTFDHKRAALRWAQAEEQKVVDGSTKDPSRGRMKWAAWCEVWWPTRQLEFGTLRSQIALRDGYVLPRWGDVPLNKIDHPGIQGWVNSLRPGLSASSARQCYYQLSASLKDAVRAGVLEHSPCFGIRLPALPPAPERYLSDDEVDILFHHFDGVYRLLVEVLVETGLRMGEAVALHRSRIDFTARVIDVVETVDRYHKVIRA
jgi:integrase